MEAVVHNAWQRAAQHATCTVHVRVLRSYDHVMTCFSLHKILYNGRMEINKINGD